MFLLMLLKNMIVIVLEGFIIKYNLYNYIELGKFG